MSWSLFRWTWLLEAPLYVGTAPAGSLNRCRLYVPARALWGALTVELAERQVASSPQYEQTGKALQEHARFTYLYPAEKAGERWRVWLPRYERGNGLVWRREDHIDHGYETDRAFRMRLLGTRPSTAIDPSSDTAAEGSLRETECMNTRWHEEDRTLGSLVALVGYVLLRIGAPELRAVEAIAAGGDTRYGLGRLQRIEWTDASRVFGRAVQLEDAEPSIESDLLLAHADAPGDLNGQIRGQREALGGWDYGKHGVQRIAGALWMPGSRLDSARPWILASNGLWRVPKPGVAP